MNGRMFCSLIIFTLLFLFGCQQSHTQSGNMFSEINLEDFEEPEPSEWMEYTKALHAYMYYRTQAVIEEDTEILTNQYPDLKSQSGDEEGLNSEINEAKFLNQTSNVIDANYDIEYYNRIKRKTIADDEVSILLHGNLIYLDDDFESSGGEIVMLVHLNNEENQWRVNKTQTFSIDAYKDNIAELE